MEKIVRRALLTVATVGSVTAAIWAAVEGNAARIAANRAYINERVGECNELSHAEDRAVCRSEVARRYED